MDEPDPICIRRLRILAADKRLTVQERSDLLRAIVGLKATHQVGGGIHTGQRSKPRLPKKYTHLSPVRFAEALVSLARWSRDE